ncbi:MAG: hypothetical protein ACI9TH_000048 [Kiritimatiellia bacterium]|jgi:uncharacterized protein YeaO (DUF488 family)
MPIILKQISDKPNPEDGYRVFVDQAFPKGLTEDDAEVDEWLEEVAPSMSLRKSLQAGALTWGKFRQAYLIELRGHSADLAPLIERAEKERVTLLFSADNDRENNAAVIKQFLDRRTGQYQQI